MARITAVVLAAGLSRRMGQPKMLLPWGETTVLGQVVRTLTDSATDSFAESRRETDTTTDSFTESRKETDATTDSFTESRRETDSAADSFAESRRETDTTTDSFAESRMETDVGADFEVIVIIGGAQELVEAEATRLKAEGLPVRTVFNPQYEAGEMMSSIRAGLAAIGPQAEYALIALGDQPQLSAESARRVVSAARRPGSRLVLPSFGMRRGHPWLVRRDLWPDLMTAETARVFLRAHEAEIFYVEADETVLKDLDTPEDYRQQGLNRK
jgi:molybdenum cofactor cytidylyltransferase